MTWPIEATQRALELIESQEGYRSVRYLDAVGVPTIGFGTTASVVDPVPGTCTFDQAQEWLAKYVDETCLPAIKALGVDLNPNQQAALIDLIYNEGPGCMGWKIGDDLRAGNVAGVADDFLRYDTADGAVLTGLRSRRELERALFLSPYIAPTPADPYHYLWFDTVKRVTPYGHWSEVDAVTEYDKLRPGAVTHGVKLHELREVLSPLAARVLTVAYEQPLPDGKPSWTVDHRGWRYQQLGARADGKNYA